MKVGKPKSKRVPVRLRHKIEKASAAKQRKQRKEAKKNPQWRSRLKKDPGIPNLFPYKDRILAEIEESKRSREEETLRRRELARAQRQGIATADTGAANPDADDEDEALVDPENDSLDEDDEMDEDAQNPMAALLASAQARARTFPRDDDDDEDDSENDVDEGAEAREWTGVELPRTVPADSKTRPAETPRRNLPKQALDDPLKAISTLLSRLERAEGGVQVLLDHYGIPPLVTAGSDATTRFLVEVARKRGRLGRGGVPNLPAAALTVLGDLLEERLRLPPMPAAAVAAGKKKEKKNVKGEGEEVRIVGQMAEPFRIEGLFGDDDGEASEKVGFTGMEVEA